VAELEKSVDSFMHQHVHRVSTYLDLEKGEAVAYSGVLDFQRSTNWGIMVGDALHNWRAGLDHLAYQLGCTIHDPPTCKTEFPIYWQPKRFKRDGVCKIACLPKSAQDIIEAYQPYSPTHGFPNAPKAHPLWHLQAMDIDDKHKVVNVTAVVARFDKLRPTYEDLWIVDSEEFPVVGDLEFGTPLARYEIRETGPNPKIEVEAKGAFGVQFGEGTAAANKGLLHTLRDIREAVFAVSGELLPLLK
jgi:hypothetical protein